MLANFFPSSHNFYARAKKKKKKTEKKEKSSNRWKFVNLSSMLSIIRRRLEQNRITEIPPKAFSPYRKLRRMWVTLAINPIYVSPCILSDDV